jgi:hypothetical protein
LRAFGFFLVAVQYLEEAAESQRVVAADQDHGARTGGGAERLLPAQSYKAPLRGARSATKQSPQLGDATEIAALRSQ